MLVFLPAMQIKKGIWEPKVVHPLLGVPDDKHGISRPYDADLQAQIAAKAKKEKEKTKQYRKDSL